MVSALDSGLNSPASILARDVVLCSWQDTLLSQGTGKIKLQGETLQWIAILSRGMQKYS